MKKLTLVFTVFTIVITAQSFAQSEKESGKGEFKKFKTDVSLGYAIPTGGKGSKGGALFAIEPKYAVIQNFSVGLRIELAATVSGINLSTGTINNNNPSIKAAGSLLATGDYYFSDNSTRPFVGAGAGIFQTAGLSVSSSNPNLDVKEGTKFGGMIRGGMEYKHLRIGVEYNIISKTTVPAYTYSNGTTPPTSTTIPAYDIKYSYIGLKLGVVIGGGRK